MKIEKVMLKKSLVVSSCAAGSHSLKVNEIMVVLKLIKDRAVVLR